jgi:hypothetical protein
MIGLGHDPKAYETLNHTSGLLCFSSHFIISEIIKRTPLSYNRYCYCHHLLGLWSVTLNHHITNFISNLALNRI